MGHEGVSANHMSVEEVKAKLGMKDDEFRQFIKDTQTLQQVQFHGPKSWGPSYWVVLTTFALSYPDIPTEEDRKGATKLMQEGMVLLIPCKICAEHFKHAAASVYPFTRSRPELVRWVIDIHNKVNVRTGAPAMTFEEVIGEYKHLDEVQESIKSALHSSSSVFANGLPTWMVWIMVCAVFLVVIAIFAVVQYQRRKSVRVASSYSPRFVR